MPTPNKTRAPPNRGRQRSVGIIRKSACCRLCRRRHNRHQAITELAESQASDQTIMSIAGHVSPSMLAHYSHVRLEAKRHALDALSSVLAQREMEKRRSPLVSIPPFGRGFSRHEGLSSDDFFRSACNAGEEPPALLSLGSMSLPDYPSAWLHPCRARLRFTRQVHCSSPRHAVLNCWFARQLSMMAFNREEVGYSRAFPLPPCSQPKALIKCSVYGPLATKQASLPSKQSATFGRGPTYI
jgi:hypothetical protein